jgi:hypothetical protein
MAIGTMKSFQASDHHSSILVTYCFAVPKHLRRITARVPAGSQMSTLSNVMTLSISAEKSGQETLETRLERLAFEREMYEKARGGLPKS